MELTSIDDVIASDVDNLLDESDEDELDPASTTPSTSLPVTKIARSIPSDALVVGLPIWDRKANAPAILERAMTRDQRISLAFTLMNDLTGTVAVDPARRTTDPHHFSGSRAGIYRPDFPDAEKWTCSRGAEHYGFKNHLDSSYYDDWEQCFRVFARGSALNEAQWRYEHGYIDMGDGWVDPPVLAGIEAQRAHYRRLGLELN
jgi:hypothetical protein